MSTHKEHRLRVKERFLRDGLDNFDEVHVLEFLLFFGIPQGDTNELAHRLLDQFGGLTQVLEAPVEELKKVKGVGDHTATLLSLITAVSRYYMVKRTEPCEPLTTVDQCANYLVEHFRGRRDEVVFLLCLDAKCKIICCREISQGSVNYASVPIRRVVETALGVNATTVILAHNHPSGVAVPSVEDVATTRRLAHALDGVDIVLADHIVVADDDYVSMVQSRYYDPNECRMVL